MIEIYDSWHGSEKTRTDVITMLKKYTIPEENRIAAVKAVAEALKKELPEDCQNQFVIKQILSEVKDELEHMSMKL